MGATKIFDIVINSKYTPTGVRGFLGDLKSLGETSTFIQTGLIAPLQDVAQSVLRFIEIANPERIERFNESIGRLEKGIANMVDVALGPAVDEISGLLDGITALSNFREEAPSIFQQVADESSKAGDSVIDTIRKVQAESDKAVQIVEQTLTEQARLTRSFAGIQLFEVDQDTLERFRKTAEESGITQEQFRDIILQSSGSLTEYINGLDLAGVKYADLSEEVDRFNEAQGRVAPTFRDIIAAQQEFVAGVAAIGQERLQLEERIGERLGDLLMDQAIRRSDALEDQARNSARRLAAISNTRIEAIQQASEDLTSELADIDNESARDRIRIEQRFQERIRQIKNQFGDQIEEAIRRRDARGLAQALKGQKDQLGQATRDRDQQASDRAQDTSDRQKEAQERQKEQEQQAEEAASRAIEQLQEQTRTADEERNRAFRRQQRDQGIGFDRLRRGQTRADSREIVELRNQSRKKIAEINRYFDEVESIIDSRLAVGGRLADAIQAAIVTGLDFIFRD